MPGRKLNVCVFGSSSATTPQPFLDVSHELGVLLAKAGHLNINGGGGVGCMGALNKGCKLHHGRVRGVIHEEFVVDGKEFVIENMIVATGNNLSARKRMLVEEADCIITLPGGTGTWDELFEVLTEVRLGFSQQPLCLVNIDGFYDGIIAQLDRAEADTLLNGEWRSVLHVVGSASEALAWCEAQVADLEKAEAPPPSGRRLRKTPKPRVEVSQTSGFWGTPAAGFALGTVVCACVAVASVALGRRLA
eukprot:GDKH01024714.1.p1 GENE.GDKH01024714.1~~GDKH01024714.1.p1  ORF type:complete len:248 (+),score=37.41 GDKH01024714.1:115-858(+)